jgi:hypothetical protein
MEPLRIMPWNLAWRTPFAGHLLPLAPMDFLNPWIRLVRVEGLNSPRVFDPGGCFSKRYYHHMLFGAYSKYHPQHLPDSRFRFSTFRLSLPYGRRLLKNHIRLGTLDITWTSEGHQKDTKMDLLSCRSRCLRFCFSAFCLLSAG